VQAWANYAAGNSDDAVRQLRAVANDQDKVGKAETELPAREMLANMLLDLKRPQEALIKYEISLCTDPNRFNGLYGAAQAAAQVRQKEKAHPLQPTTEELRRHPLRSHRASPSENPPRL